MKEIPVEQIMNEIRTDIANKEYNNANGPKFSDIRIGASSLAVDKKTLEFAVSEARLNSQVDMYPAVSGGILERFIKKLIRKIVRPSFYGQMKKQEKFNVNCASALSSMSTKIRELEEKIMMLEEKLN